MRKNKFQLGFTLGEILIVMLIIAIVASVALLRVGDFSYGKSARDVSRQLVAYCRVTQQQAILQPAVLGLEINQRGYQAFRFDEDSQAWVSLNQDDHFWREQRVPETIQMEVSVDSQALSFPTTVTQHSPQIIFSPSGELSPFSIQIRQRGKSDVYAVKGNFVGLIEMSP
jgi:general secretion pathway protein H